MIFSVRPLVSLSLLLSGVALSGCATDCATNSPNNESLLQSSAGLASGCYEQRLSEREQRLAEERVYQQNVETRLQELAQKKDDRIERRDKLSAQLLSMRSHTQNLASEIAALDANTDAEMAEINELKAQAEALELAIVELRNESDVSESNIEQYERQVAGLQKEYSLLERVTRAFGE